MSILQKLEMQKRINFIEDLSNSDLDILAKLFSFPTNTTTNEPSPNDLALFPPEDWLAHQSELLSPSSSSFPAHLLRSTSLLPRLAQRLPFAAPRAMLCSTHKPLNPFLVRRIFMQLSAETGLRVQGLVEAVERERAGAERGKGWEGRKAEGEGEGGGGSSNSNSSKSNSYQKINVEVRAWLRRLTMLNSLWMNPTSYRTRFHAKPNDERFARLDSGCMACILALVGGRAQAVTDLKTSMLGRMRRGHEARLWVLMEAWTRRFAAAERIKRESERVSKLVKTERRRARRRRRRRERRERRLGRRNRRGSGGGSGRRRKAEEAFETPGIIGGGGGRGGGDGAADVDDEPYGIDDCDTAPPRAGPGDREAEERDFESSIIDFYHDAAAAVGDDVDDQSLHPAFRRSVAYDITTGTFHRRSQHAPRGAPPSRPNRHADRARSKSRFTFYTQSAYSQDGGFEDGGGGIIVRRRAQDGVPPPPPQPLPQPLPTPGTTNPFVKGGCSSSPSRRHNNNNNNNNAQDRRHVAERRAESYRKLVGRPGREDPAREAARPSAEEMRGFMKTLWEPSGGGGVEGSEEEEEDEEEDEAEEEARHARVQKALADAYGGDRSVTDEEKRETQMTTWSGMMRTGGGERWLGL